jgi:glycosyltransferase involved in cell wall biosynthesis
LHICHITTVHPRLDTRIFQKECCSLIDLGHQVTLICNKGKSEVVESVNIISLEVPYEGLLGRIKNVPKAIYKKALEVDADIYHFHDPDFLYHGLQLIKQGKKVVYDAHEDVPRQLLSKPYGNKLILHLISNLFEPFEDYVVKRLTGIVTADEKVFHRFKKVNSNTILLNNYPILGQFDTPIPYSKKEKEVFYVGDIAAIRGVIEMVKAMEYVEGFTLVLAGIFESENLEQLARNLPQWNKVRYEGYIDSEKRAELLERAQVGLVVLHPVKKYEDALPTKLFEYMAAGVAVVCTNLKLWADIVTDSNCGLLVNPLEPKEIGDAINRLIKDPVKAQEYGLNGYNTAIKKYSWSTEKPKLELFYTRMI